MAPPPLTDWLDAQRDHWDRAHQAMAHLRRATELEGSDVPAPAQALDLAHRAIEAAPWLAEAWLALTRLLYLKGDAPGARSALERTLAARPLHEPTRAQALEVRRALDRSLFALPRPAPLPVGLIRPPVLVGHRALWAAMNQAWAERRAFVLLGEAGLGKSRLLEEFLADHGGGLLVAADFQGERAPYGTLAALLNHVVQRCGLSAHDIPLPLAGILGLARDTLAVAPVDEVAVRQAAGELLSTAAPQWRAMAVDRLDNADAASIAVLRDLADGPLRDRFRFAFASRPPVPGVRRDVLDAWFASAQGAVPLALARWRPEQIGELLHTLELPRAAAHVTPTALHAHTEGVPQLVLFTLQRLATSDAPDIATTVPATPASDQRAELRARLRSVPPAARPLLELAAVLDAEPPLLARALNCSEVDVAAMAAELAVHHVMFEGRFLHDLMREAALESLPPAAVQRWNAVAAALLAPDRRVPRTKIAAHWEAAERWPEAAAAYLAAAVLAEDLGRLDDVRDLLHASVACAVRANDPAAEFSALERAVYIERQLAGQDPARKLLERLRALATMPRQRTQVALADALLEVSRYRRGSGALRYTGAAVEATDALGDNELRARAMGLHAAALAQAGRHAEAVAEGHRARQLALLAAPPRKAREIGTDLCYVFYEASRFDAGIALGRELLADFEAAQDPAGAGAMQGNLAMLLLLSGNPAAAVPHARRALARHREVEPSALGDMAVMHRAGLAQALGHLGCFTEALGLLHEGGRPIEASPLLTEVRAKVRLVRAQLLLWLGDETGAVDALDDDVAAWPMSMKVQRCGALARAAGVRGEDATALLRQMATLVADAGDTPLAHMPWLDWSHQGEPAPVDERLREVHRLYVAAGMQGTARSVLLRRIDRLGELPFSHDREEAAALAAVVHKHLHEGLHATTYLPEARLILARTLQRGGDIAAARACLEQAGTWVSHAAQHQVPDQRIDAFLNRNPVHRRLATELAKAGLPPLWRPSAL